MSAPQREQTASAVIIGNEILTGKITDLNLPVLARSLRKLGIRLRRAVTIPDELATIASAVRSASRADDWVFTSGGVGPTHDDVTIDAVARAFSRPVVVSPRLEDLIRNAYGDKLREGHLLMARMPKGARLVSSAEIPWPTVLMRNVWVLPGVPEIFALKMKLVEDTIAHGAAAFVTMSLSTSLDEGNIKPALDAVVEAHPSVDIGSYPQWGHPTVRTKVTFDARSREDCERARGALEAALPPGSVLGVEG
ncbi:MAG: molybdopterin-binding protein [Polyangiaceae bacterium]